MGPRHSRGKGRSNRSNKGPKVAPEDVAAKQARTEFIEAMQQKALEAPVDASIHPSRLARTGGQGLASAPARNNAPKTRNVHENVAPKKPATITKNVSEKIPKKPEVEAVSSERSSSKRKAEDSITESPPKKKHRTPEEKAARKAEKRAAKAAKEAKRAAKLEKETQDESLEAAAAVKDKQAKREAKTLKKAQKEAKQNEVIKETKQAR